MNNTDLALYLTRAAGYHYNQRVLNLAPSRMQQAVADLAAPDLLSERAIAAIVGCPVPRVRKMWPEGQPRTRHRGTLDPRYLSYISYLLSGVRLMPFLLDELLTTSSPGIVSRLTNISVDTLQRWRKA